MTADRWVHLLRRRVWLPLPPAEVFPFFAAAENLARITPPELRFRYLTPLPIEMRVGATIDYRLSLFHVPFRWRTRVVRWEPVTGFVDVQVRGPYRLWEHHHRFHAAEGGTRMEDEVRWALPLAPFGELVRPLVRYQLERIFDYRERRIRELLPGPAPLAPEAEPI